MPYTAGPWRAVYDGSSTWSVGPDEDPQDGRVAMVERRGDLDTWEEASDTARLIAAAPDLYQAANGAVDLIEAWMHGICAKNGIVWDAPEDHPPALKALRAAITKAIEGS
jgi:hypothetical protein